MKNFSIRSQSVSTLESANAQDVEETLNFGRVFSAIRRQAFLIGAITAAMAALAGARAKLTPADYTATFEILIQLPSGEAEVANTISGLPQQTNEELLLEDQVKVLTSPRVMGPVVEKVLSRDLKICQDSPSIRSNLTTNLALVIDENESCYKAIQENLDVQLSELKNDAQFGGETSRIFIAQYTDSSPESARQIAELISQRFLDYGLESRQRDIQQAIDFLDGKLPDVRRQVNILQQKLQALRETNNLITPEARGAQLSNQIGNYESEYLDVLVELQETRTLYSNLQDQLTQRPQDQAASPVLSNSERYQTLIRQLLELDNEIAAASTLFVDSSPDMQVLVEQRQKLLELLSREGENAKQELIVQMAGLSKREEALAATLTSLNGEVDSLAGITREFTDLQRELDIATENLTQLLARRETLQIEAAQRQLPWELISPATLEVNTPSLPINLALGLVLGSLLGVVVALIIDAQQDVLYSSNDLKRITPVPILGFIPNSEIINFGYDQIPLRSLYNTSGNLTVESGKNYFNNGDISPQALHEFKEAFRTLMANLQRADQERPLNSLVLSSVDEELHDSTTAAYLAWVAAEMGNRVLLIDADFRESNLHEVFDLPNYEGFSTLLVEDTPLRLVYRESPREDNLFVVTTGNVNLDPSRLLMSNNIRKLVQQAEAEFDLVLFNCPPFSQYADAGLIAAETSGLILLSHLGMVKSYQLEETLERLWVSQLPLIGLIAKETSTKSSLLPAQKLFDFARVS